MIKKLSYLLLILFLFLPVVSCQKISTKNENPIENSPPELIAPEDGRIIAGETLISTDFNAADPDSDSTAVSILDVIPEVTNNPMIVANHVEWITTDNEAGNYIIRLVASDSEGAKDTCGFTVNVFNQPTDFPSIIGTQFVFLFVNNLSITSDTVIVSIVGNTTFDENKQATVWEYEFSSKTDTEYVYFSGDTVKVYDDLSSWWINTKYVFPLELGKGWKGDFATDTSTVFDITSISVPAGDFSNAFVIEEAWAVTNEYGHVVTWFVPKVGIVKKLHREIAWTYWVDTEWELIDYHVFLK
jgi:hypothetical protein